MLKKQQIPSLDRSFLMFLVAVVVLTLASGVLYGRLTQRWGPTADLIAAAEHVRSFPKQLGAWQLLEETTMPDSVQQTLECAGYVNRQYIHPETGQSVGFALIVGPPGPTAVHTPEICYSSRSYKVKESSQRVDSEEQGHSFWGVRFQSRRAGTPDLQVYYAWNNGNKWEASENPRIKFGGNQLLYKVQISGAAGLGFGNELTNPALEFSKALTQSSWSPMNSNLDK